MHGYNLRIPRFHFPIFRIIPIFLSLLAWSASYTQEPSEFPSNEEFIGPTELNPDYESFTIDISDIQFDEQADFSGSESPTQDFQSSSTKSQQEFEPPPQKRPCKICDSYVDEAKRVVINASNARKQSKPLLNQLRQRIGKSLGESR